MGSDRILLGITGSAAAFKGVMLASMLRREGFAVDGIITESGLGFITDTQLACVTGRPVHTSLFAPQPGDPVPHITLTDDVSLLAVVPATADFLAKAACGLADDLLSSVFLACDAKVLMAPSMNSRMWNNPATRNNVNILAGRGVEFAGPVEGELACGASGPGRLMEPEGIFRQCMKILERDS